MGQSLDTIDAPPDTTGFCMPEPGKRFPTDDFPELPGGRRRRRRRRWLPYDDPNKPPDPNEWVRRLPKPYPDFNPNEHVLWQDPVAAYLKENRGLGKVGQ